MEPFLYHPVYFWLALGGGLIIMEALTAPGLGIFLAGLGALGTAIVIQAGLIGTQAFVAQFVWFFGLTAFFTAALWKKLRQWRSANGRKESMELNTMIGATAFVGQGGLTLGVPGQVLWSGTVMTAELDAKSPVPTLPEGAMVEIVSVSGITVGVIPK